MSQRKVLVVERQFPHGIVSPVTIDFLNRGFDAVVADISPVQLVAKDALKGTAARSFQRHARQLPITSQLGDVPRRIHQIEGRMGQSVEIGDRPARRIFFQPAVGQADDRTGNARRSVPGRQPVDKFQRAFFAFLHDHGVEGGTFFQAAASQSAGPGAAGDQGEVGKTLFNLLRQATAARPHVGDAADADQLRRKFGEALHDPL